MGIKKDFRPIRVEGDIAFIPLTKGYEAVIDAADTGLVDGFHWYATQSLHTVYAEHSCNIAGRRTSVSLHRIILGDADGLKVDHADGNGLNNRRSNLRRTSHSKNICNQRRRVDNQSGFKGVSPARGRKKWQARITAHGQRRCLGYFDTPEEAHAAYCAAAAEHFGEFARSA